jgi:predicted SAM-dependent methyltransferase
MRQALSQIYIFLKAWITIFRIKWFYKKNPLRISLGSSGVRQKSWIQTDKESLDLLRPKTWQRCLRTNSVDALFAEHVWEHLTENEGLIAAKTCYLFLKKGGYLRVAVPDGYHPNGDYINCVRPGGYGAGASDHKVLYNYTSFRKIFEQAGFAVRLLEYFDEHGKFNFESWDESQGKVRRSMRYDARNSETPLKMTSLILDAIK